MSERPRGLQARGSLRLRPEVALGLRLVPSATRGLTPGNESHTDQDQDTATQQVGRATPATPDAPGENDPHQAEQSGNQADHDTRQKDGNPKERHAQPDRQGIDAR